MGGAPRRFDCVNGPEEERRTIRRRPVAPVTEDPVPRTSPPPRAARTTARTGTSDVAADPGSPSTGREKIATAARDQAPARARRRRPPTGRPRLTVRVGLVLILLMAGAVRVGGAWAGTDCVIVDGLRDARAARAAGRCVSFNDSATYLTHAEHNADGDWFQTQGPGGRSVDTALHAPMFGVILTPFVWAGIDSYEALRYVVAILGTAGVAAVFLLGRTLRDDATGLIAATIAALHPLVWINDVLLMPEGLFAVAVAGTSVLAYRFHARPSVANAAWLGAAIGAAGLLRNEALLTVAFIAVPLILGRRSLSLGARAVRGAALVGAVALLLAPWIGLNWARFGSPVLTHGTGAGLRASTCDETFFNERLLGLRSIDCLGEDREEASRPGQDNEEASSRIYQRNALAYYSDNLGRAPTVVLARVARFWGAWRPFETVRLDDPIEQRGTPRSQGGIVVGWALTPLAAYGAVVLWRRRIPLSPLLGWIAAATTVAAASQPLQRFRISGDVAMIVLGAVGVVALAGLPSVRTLVTGGSTRAPTGLGPDRAGSRPAATVG